MSEVDFIRYVSLLKNVRGILVATSKIEESVLKWLRRSIRWRPIGASQSTLNLLKKSGFSAKKIEKLVFPSESFKKFAHILTRMGVDKELAESITLSCSYIVPLIILDKISYDILAKRGLIATEVLIKEKLKDKAIKLHMRIAEYSMKDFHFKVITEAKKQILQGKMAELIRRRHEICKKDARRYWRIKSSSGTAAIIYVDPLRVFANDVNPLKKLLLEDDRIILSLGIPVGIVIPNMLLRA